MGEAASRTPSHRGSAILTSPASEPFGFLRLRENDPCALGAKSAKKVGWRALASRVTVMSALEDAPWVVSWFSFQLKLFAKTLM